MRWGTPENSVSIGLVGLMIQFFMIILGMPWYYLIIWMMGIVFFFAAILYPNLKIIWNQLRPEVDKCKPGETVWIRITKNRRKTAQFARNSAYGLTKGVVNHEKAGIIDDGSFPITLLNGNPAILVYDMMNTNVDIKKSIARKKMKEIFNIRSGVEGYEKAVRENKIISSEEKKGYVEESVEAAQAGSAEDEK